MANSVTQMSRCSRQCNGESSETTKNAPNVENNHIRSQCRTKARFCRVTSVWSAPPIEEVLEQASFFSMREYLKRRQTIEYVATRPIYREATTTARRSGSSTRRKFWGMTLQRDDQLGS